MLIRYERLSAVDSGTAPCPGAQWEPVSTMRLERILSLDEIRISLIGGRVIKTITSWYRAVLVPSLADLQASRVALRDHRGNCHGWGYDGLPYYMETATDEADNLVLVLRGPGIKTDTEVYHFSDLPRIEKRIYSLAVKKNLFGNTH